MKAIVKATGEIIELSDLEYDVYGNDYLRTELEITDEPDYWEKLKHQYAGMAMQGLMSKEILDTSDSLSSHAIYYATALVNRLKKEEK